MQGDQGDASGVWDPSLSEEEEWPQAWEECLWLNMGEKSICASLKCREVCEAEKDVCCSCYHEKTDFLYLFLTDDQNGKGIGLYRL